MRAAARFVTLFVLASAWGAGCAIVLGRTIPGCVVTVAGAFVIGYVAEWVRDVRRRRALEFWR